MAAVQRIVSVFNVVNIASTMLLFAAGIGLSRLLAAPRFGLALVALGLLLLVPLMMVVIAKPRVGVFLLFILASIIVEVKRLSWEVEVGLAVEMVEVVLAISLISSMVVRRDVYRLSSPLTLPVVVYVLYQVLQAVQPSLPTIYNTVYALRDPINFAVPFFAAVYLVRDRQQLRFFLVLWLGLAVVLALYGLYQYYVGLTHWEITWLASSPTHLLYDRLRIFSTLGSADNLGMHMALSVVLAIGLAAQTKSRLLKFGAMSLVPLFVLVNMYTLTRGAYVATVVGVLTLALLTRSKPMLLGLVVAGVASVGWYQVSQESVLASRLVTMFSPDQDESFTIRQNYVQDYFPVILERPFGFGPATSGRQGWVLLEWGGIDPRVVESLATVPTDNYYFKTALETGWVGLLLFLALLVWVFVVGLRTFRVAKDPLVRWLAASLISAYTAMAVASVSNNYFSHVELKLFFWFTIGVLANLPRIDRQPERTEAVVAPDHTLYWGTRW